MTEIIDVKEPNKLEKNWMDFLFSHHYFITDDFYKSGIAKHPRRSCEALYASTIEGKFVVHDNSIPRDYEFEELYKWLEPLKKIEEAAEANN
jgi:hypothetical protein